MRTLVILLKAPEAGRVKTRLARDLGTVRALSIYRWMSARLMRRLSADPRWRTVLAIAPDRRVGDAGRGPVEWPCGLRRIAQGRGTLGDRMARVMRAQPPGPVVLIGSDSPDVSPAHIERAFRALGRSDAVFGPAPDGGFWLVGLRRRPFPDGIFDQVRWSGPHALEDVLANLRPRLRVSLIDELPDIDTAEDWAQWRAQRPQDGRRQTTM